MAPKQIFLFIGLILTATIHSQSIHNDTVDFKDLMYLNLEELLDIEVFSASKKNENIVNAASNITVVTNTMIKEWGVRDLKDVLRRVAGYQVIADRDEWVCSSRGIVSDNNQKYLILIDGHRMNSIENFRPDFITGLPSNLSNVKRIEIIKGPGSAVWGADALAGIINIITLNADDLKNNYNIGLTYGQHNYKTLDFQLGKSIKDEINFTLNGMIGDCDGKKVTQSASTNPPFPILDTETNYFSHPYGTYKTLLNQRNLSYMLQLKSQVENFSINSMVFNTELFNRHFEYGQDRENYIYSYNSFIECNYDKDLNEHWNFHVNTASFINNSEFLPKKHASGKKLPVNVSWKDRGVYFGMDIHHDSDHLIRVTGGIDYTYTKLGPNYKVDSLNINSPFQTTTAKWQDENADDHQIGTYIHGQFTINNHFKVVAGNRIDYNKRRGDDNFALSPRLALLFNPTTITSLKLIYNSGYLRPTNLQLSGRGASSEKMKQVEIIWLQQMAKLTLSTILYWQKLKGIILVLPSSFGFSNTGDYESYGIETGISGSIHRNVNIWLNGRYGVARGENFHEMLSYNSQRTDLNNHLLNFPSLIVNMGGTTYYFNKKLFASPFLRIKSPAKYRVVPSLSAEADTEDNYKKTPTFMYLDCNIGYEPTPHVGFYLNARNIFNMIAPTYLSVWNGTIDQFGRQILLRCRMHF